MKKNVLICLKKTGCIGLAVAVMASSYVPLFAAEQESNEISLNVLSDLHYYPLSLSGGEDSLAGSDFRLKNESTAATDAAIEQVIKNKPEMLVITGDLTNNGERESAEELAKKLKTVEDAGIPVYVINGNHDIQGSSGEDLTASQFRSIFKEYGYNGDDQAVYYQPTNTSDGEAKQGGLSYVVSPKPGVKLLMIDTEVYTDDYKGTSDGMISDDLMAWIQQQAAIAKENGETLVTGMHHPLLSHYSGSRAGSLSDTIDDSIITADKLADSGIEFVLSGHMHENDVAERVSAKGNRILDMETAALVAYGAPVRTVTVNQNNMTVQSNSVKEINWGGNTINYQEHMDNILYPDGFFISKASGAVNGYLNDIQEAGIKATIENLADININELLSSTIETQLAEPVTIPFAFGQLKGLQLQYEGGEDPAVILRAITEKPNSNFPDLRISIANGVLKEVDNLFAQIDQNWLSDNGGDSRIKQEVVKLLQDMSDAVVYDDGKGTTKTLSDFLAEMLKVHNLGGETLQGWTKEVAENLRVDLTRKLVKDVMLPDIMNVLQEVMKDTTIDLQGLTNATGAWTSILAMLGDNPSLSDLLDLASIDINEMINDLVLEYVDNDSYVSMVGQPLSSLALGFLEDTPGEDDQIDGEAVTYPLEEETPVITPDKTSPVLTIPEDGSISKNATFDPMNGVSAKDDVDGDISDKITLQGNVDTAVPGTYTLVYAVEDAAGNRSEAQRIITVVDDTKQEVTTIRDNQTGMTVTGRFPQNAQLSVGVLNSGSIYDTVSKLWKKDAQKSIIYDVALLKDGKTIQPDGSVTMTIPVPKEYDEKKSVLYHITKQIDGTYTSEKMKVQVKDGVYTFTTDGLGMFAIVQTKNDTTQLISNKPHTNAPQTGDVTRTGALLFTIMLSAGALCIAEKKRCESK